jgi:alpha-tubulin suppressor-like RCC1 family protein
MKCRSLRDLPLGKSILVSFFFSLLSLLSLAQSESHDFITYDTLINYTCFPAGPGGCTGSAFRVRISRPRNYFVAGNADTASRPWFLTMQGAGEVGSDTTKLVTYGPHYWLQNGWNGGVQLRNGRHYPILITIMPQATNPPVAFVQALMDTLIRRYHPRRNSLHVAGLSMGFQVLSGYVQYSATAGDEHNMANVRSLVDLQGEAPDSHGVGPTYPSFFGHWAHKYGGRFFGLEGYNDSRNIWQISDNMNDSVISSAYFAYENIDTGKHCCWNTMYDPSDTNWQCIDTLGGTRTNPYINPTFYQHPNRMGNYYVDHVTGSSIFQWMLRQGDTTLIDTGAVNIPPTFGGYANKTDTLPVDSVVLTGSVTGHSGATIHAITWTPTSGPNSPTIVTSNSGQTATIHGLIQGTYIFTITATDTHFLSASIADTVTVIGPPPTFGGYPNKTDTLPVDSVVLTGSVTAHGGASIHAIVWTTTSGPNSPIIVTSNSAQTATIHGLIQGTYIFTVTATDSHGLTSSTRDTVTVYGVSTPAVTTPKTLVATGEYQVFFIDSSKHLYAVGTNLNTLGVSSAGTPGTAIAVAVPSGLKFTLAAGGLHGGAAVDTAGNLWSWGDNDQGQVGNGAVSSTPVTTPVEITTDSSGNAFTGIKALCAYFSGNVSEGWYAVKSDSTLWVWGQTLGGMRGNGTSGSSSLTRPAQVPIPGNRKVMQVVAGNELIVLCTDSTVWSCGGTSNNNPQNLGYTVSGNSYLSLQQLTTLSGISKIAGGANFNYALKSNGTLYGWGYYGCYMGGTGGYASNTPLATPTDLTTRLSLPHPIKSIVSNMVCTHAILSDSTLWGWGDNAEGNIGNGTELNFATTTMPYAWDYAPAELLQQAPVQVTTRHDFVAIFATQPFVMYVYAETAAGQLYSWGRNKGGVLGNGIVGCSSDVVGIYPNSWDITTPTLVNPLSLISTTVGPCPYCTAHPDSTPCNECSGSLSRIAPVKTNTAADLAGSGHIAEQFRLYPSVAQNDEELHMIIASDSLGPVRISIYDMSGKLVKTLQFYKGEPYFSQLFNAGHLPAGMFLVRAVIGTGKQFTTKFIRL